MSINYPPLKEEHLALLHHSGTSRRWEFLVQHAGRQEQQRAATSLSTLGVCWCQWVPKSEQDDDHGWIVWGRGGWWFRPWSLSRDLCSPQCGLCLPVDNLPGSAAPAKRGNPSSWMSALNLSSLLFFCSVFTAMKIPHSTERLPFFALSESL